MSREENQNRKNKHKSKHKSKFASVLSVLGTVLLIAVIVLCVPITIPQMFGYQVYTVISGSMEPAIPTDSLVYTKSLPPENVKVDDVIAFYSADDTGAIITHRVVKNQVVEGQFVTKGDANDQEDPMPTAYSNLLGRVELTIPFMGKLLATVASTAGKIATVSLIGVAVLLHIIAGVIRRGHEEEEE
ncbi:MAG: signal peptidase I [Faecalicatena sp.]|uniref:signal peptidase I n=1 Tax=Faecalicatena sp. TaxID=2005360 RepID=UPI00258E3122|nr:signal peptidase I [Faecalicatena sp.]MCI6466731.1 signal peptidase I [Faecalicatena sp.]MCI7181970.1 signal peptidase I [Lachnospiraceae bacterium]MDY5619121.1 signal peptidase I [Lachnospiraceae bacterium]